MPLEIITVPCRTDNYAYLLHDAQSGETALVDAPEARPVHAALRERGWGLDKILITHHHQDHIDAVGELTATYGAGVVGAAADAHRLPPLDRSVSEDDAVTVGREVGRVIEVPGHTLGHIAFHFPQSNAVFTADSLMSLGCGRLFEGTAEMMWRSLCKLAALPAQTLVCSGHEYTAANAKFALTIDRGNPALKSRAEATTRARAEARATVPSVLAEELATNPFLRAAHAELKVAVGMADAPDVAVFAEIRHRKDVF